MNSVTLLCGGVSAAGLQHEPNRKNIDNYGIILHGQDTIARIPNVDLTF
jgi:hypothetical protein